MIKYILLVLAINFSFALNAQEIVGDWNGTLEVQGTQLPVIFHISETEDGLTATMDSPKQQAFGIPASSVNFENDSLKMEFALAGITYEGVLNENGIIEGHFKQNGLNLQLNLKKGKLKKKVVSRPQEPTKPFPYYTEEVAFQNKKEKITLAGTLSLPAKTGNFPAVILISGSGPQNRNSEVFGHKPFLVLADYLTKKGIAVLRYDDRGVAESEGNFSTATTTDFATDVEAAVNFLKSREEIDENKIGLIGHSEGGLVAPMVANSNDDVNFIVLLAAPGIRGDKLLLLQKEKVERAMGISEFAIATSKGIFAGAYDIILKMEYGPELKAAVHQYFKENLGANLDTDRIARISEAITSPWFVEFVKYDPAIALEQVQVPVLALGGEKDLQVPSQINLAAIKQALEKAGNSNITIKKFEKLNHLFQESETGLPNEYARIEQTFSPKALEYIAAWIMEQVE